MGGLAGGCGAGQGDAIMIEVKVSGRGGQGAVLASQILATGFFQKGLYVQSFPSFGAERRGAPVSAFVRADSREITLRYSVQHPDWIVLLDSHLLDNPMVMGGMSEKTSLLINAPEGDEVHGPGGNPVFVVDATGIAEKLRLKTTSFSIVNTAMVGAFAKASNLLELDGIVEVIKELVPIKKDDNADAARQAYERVREIR
jgi:2-oxoacid:acceptor oxidoreductase gamma subunit (pyruvate/2-ketoisovalerate family)